MLGVPIIPYINEITFQFEEVFLMFCITICDNTTIFQVKEFTEVGGACLRSPCWHMACLTPHSLVSKCSIRCFLVPTSRHHLDFLPFLWLPQGGQILAVTNISVSSSWLGSTIIDGTTTLMELTLSRRKQRADINSTFVK